MIGPLEIVIPLVVGLLLIAGLTAAVVVARLPRRRLDRTALVDSVADLRAEMQDLREDVEEPKKRPA